MQINANAGASGHGSSMARDLDPWSTVKGIAYGLIELPNRSSPGTSEDIAKRRVEIKRAVRKFAFEHGFQMFLTESRDHVDCYSFMAYSSERLTIQEYCLEMIKRLGKETS